MYHNRKPIVTQKYLKPINEITICGFAIFKNLSIMFTFFLFIFAYTYMSNVYPFLGKITQFLSIVVLVIILVGSPLE